MIPHAKRISMAVGVLLLVVLFGGRGQTDQVHGDPKMHVPQTKHSFGPVFEGEDLSHSFEVGNRGKSDLLIEKVTHS
jgi:hypothetical protein